MTQNIYDDPEFFRGYSHLRRSIEGLGGGAEWPSLRALLPDLRGLKIVDLGCGFGWFCRWAREQGATKVLGLDVSEKMLARAEGMTSDAAITFARIDLESLDLPAAAFDLAYSSLALHYIADLDGLLMKVHRSLVSGAQLLFSVEHPIYTAPTRPDWLVDTDGRKTWPINGYLVEGSRNRDWFVKGVKQHRTIATYLNLLIRLGFKTSHVEEWGPTDEQIAATPDLADERERPMFLLVASQK
jgi:SAM-dependent methyltransferase